MKIYEKPVISCRRFHAELQLDASSTAESRAKAAMTDTVKTQTGSADSVAAYIVRDWS